MGALASYIPFTAQMMLIGSTALASFPFLSGFYSKDWIIEIAGAFFYFDGLIMLTFISQAAMFTMMYSDSLSRFVFGGVEKFPTAFLTGVGESGVKIVSSLAVLALPSIFSGFLFKDLFIGFGNFTFSDSIWLAPLSAHFFESDYMFAVWRITPVVFSFFMMFLVILGFDFLIRFKTLFTFLHIRVSTSVRGVLVFFTDFFALNWFFDATLNYWAKNSFLLFCRETTFKLIDKGVLELFGPYAFLRVFSMLALTVSKLTSGYIFHYSFLFIFGVSALILINLLVVESTAYGLLFFQVFLLFGFILKFESDHTS